MLFFFFTVHVKLIVCLYNFVQYVYEFLHFLLHFYPSFLYNFFCFTLKMSNFYVIVFILLIYPHCRLICNGLFSSHFNFCILIFDGFYLMCLFCFRPFLNSRTVTGHQVIVYQSVHINFKGSLSSPPLVLLINVFDFNN